MIAVQGEVDLANTGRLLQKLLVLTHPWTGQIALDLSQVTFMDCAGILMLNAIDSYVQARGGSVHVAAVSPAVARLFELAGSFAARPDFYAPDIPQSASFTPTLP